MIYTWVYNEISFVSGMSSLEYEASKRNIDIAFKKTFSYKEIKDIAPHMIGYVKNNSIVSRCNVVVIFAQSHHAYTLMKVMIDLIYDLNICCEFECCVSEYGEECINANVINTTNWVFIYIRISPSARTPCNTMSIFKGFEQIFPL